MRSALLDSPANSDHLSRPFRALAWRAAHLTLALITALVASLLLPSRFVTAQAPKAPPDRITLRSPDGRSEVVIAVSDSGLLRITLAPVGDRTNFRLLRSLSLRLVGRREPSLELRDSENELVAYLGGPRFRRIEP